MGDSYIHTEDGVQLFFQAMGSGGRTLVIPNGFYFLESFKRLADGRTLVFYDVRNRGRSETITDSAKLSRGILQDIDDLETVRRSLGVEQMDLLGHSYVGLLVAAYAMKHPSRVGRVVQIGPSQPVPGKQYPPDLTYADATLTEVFSKLGQMQKEGFSGTPEEICRKFTAVLRTLYVVDPKDVEKVNWGRCDLPNESGFMKYWIQHLAPSLQKLQFSPEEFARVKLPVLVVHGKKDRNAPYGGGRDWAAMLPDARLLTVENAAHAPWIEEPELVLRAVGTFLAGEWPGSAQRVGQALSR